MIDLETETALRSAAAPCAAPVVRTSVLQIVTSFGGFVAACSAMYATLDVSYWIALGFSPVAAGFLVRIFIIQHDCGHMAFFRSRSLNNAVGAACSLLTLAPYASWRRQHAGHHRMWNNLDRRNSGADIYSTCLTVGEYRALSAFGRFRYRVLRHPVVANLVLPPLIFVVLYRFPFDMPREWASERRAVLLTDMAVAGIIVGLGLLIGFRRVVAVQAPVMLLASIVGVWLFAVQHRGDRIQWLCERTWSPATAAVESSTFLRLPRLLQWFTGNIGFHHIHHLRTRIPNYRLRECHLKVAALVHVREVSITDGFRSLSLALWDEKAGRLIPFSRAWNAAAGMRGSQ